MTESRNPGNVLDLLESVLDKVPSAVVVKDRAGVVLYANPTYASLHGLSVDGVVGRTEWDFMSADAAARFHAADLTVIDQDNGIQFDDALPTPQGVRYFKTAKFPLYDSTGRVVAICAVATEVTAERRLEVALRRSRDQLHDLAEWSPGTAYQFRHRADGGYDIPYASRGIRGVFEIEPESVADDAQPVFSRIHPDDLDAFRRSIEASEHSCEPWQMEFRVILPVAGVRWIRGSSVPERVDGATIWHGYAEDITARKLSEQEVWRRANYDSLTLLPNRDLAFDRLSQALRMCRRNGTGLAVLFGDLDGFKDVNDTFGHAVGDQVLAQVGARLPECIRESDTVARIGGDEFLILLLDASHPGDVGRVTGALEEAVTRPFEIDGVSLSLHSMSIGVAYYPQDGHDAETLIRVADSRMYDAKPPRHDA